MNFIDLNHDWILHFTHPQTGKKYRIPAQVPGNVELDLAREGLLTEDPLPPDRTDAAHWVDLTDWEYEKEFVFNALPGGTGKAELVFEGIDTVASIRLNGELLYECRNMFITHRIDVTSRLRPGKNQLSVCIISAEYAARSLPQPLFWTFPYRKASAYLRKARHAWGWDNAPRRVTAGLWRPVKLEFLPETRITSVYAYTRRIMPEEHAANINLAYSLAVSERDLSSYRLHVIMELEGKRALDRIFPIFFTTGAIQDLRVENARYWNPAGQGEPVLYGLRILLEKDGQILDRYSCRFGIRTIRLERSETTTPDGQGEFQFYCNEEKLYVRGTNWKPLSPYPSETPSKLKKALDLAVECNCNMIRVWGGGVYEDDAFFDYCDEHGLLVWQDFMFACEFPPQDEAFCRETAAEAKSIVENLRNHPSLALWCGDNENDDAFLWGDCMDRTLSPKDNRVSREVLAEAIRCYDPARDYLPSSPYFSDTLIDHSFKTRCTDDILGVVPEQHIYTSGPDLPPGGFREFFRRSAAHFSSETGPIGINAMSETPELVAHELPRIKRLWNVDPDSLPGEFGDTHQCDHYCAVWCQTVQNLTRRMFGRDFSPENPDKLAGAVNFYVADLFKFVIESWRVQKFRRTGVIWWSLLDMWPMAFNYSVTDSEFHKKLPFDFIRLSQQPFALMAMGPVSSGDPVLYAVNDTLQSCSGNAKVFSLEGKLLKQQDFEMEKNKTLLLNEIPVQPGEAVLLEWETNLGAGKNFYLRYSEPLDFDYCQGLAQKIRTLH